MNHKTHKGVVGRVRPLGHVLLWVEVELTISFLELVCPNIRLVIVGRFRSKTVENSQSASKSGNIITSLFIELPKLGC